mgnify:FL=1
MKYYEILNNDNGNLALLNIVEGSSAVDALKRYVDAGKVGEIRAETELFGVAVDFAYLHMRIGELLMAQPV